MMIHCNSKKPSMRADISCTSTTAESRAKIWISVKCIQAPSGLDCCPFGGGGSVVVDLLFIVTPIVGVCNCSIFCCTFLCPF